MRAALQSKDGTGWVDPMTAERDRMYRYRRLVPMTEQQYLDESDDAIEWSLRIAALYGDEPWRKGDRRGAAGSEGVPQRGYPGRR